jgi:hypothetical protein
MCKDSKKNLFKRINKVHLKRQFEAVKCARL